MSGGRLRVVIADDERPARSFLASLVRSFDDVELVGEAANGSEALQLIESLKPDLALLDLQMPELDGLSVARLLRGKHPPLVAFVTAYDEYAVRAFEVNAVDYLLKPVSGARLRETLNRVQERLERGELFEESLRQVRAAATEYESSKQVGYVERLPVRHGDHIVLLPVAQIASVEADGELLCVTTGRGERHTLAYRLKDLEERLDPARFIRLGRGELANIDMIVKVHPMPGGTYLVSLQNGQQLPVSRIQSRILRERLLKL
ncbi:MAG TPA: LytTR family DNA-binding domain-containing protein [Vicinamibacterales bacterium]|nr:LytTR family DNA-binding domain-containing protein [Vicinamibacterales bacterium]